VPDSLSVDSFAPLVEQSFQAVAPGLDGFALRLVSAQTYRDAPAFDDKGVRSPFRLTFRGPAEGILPQGTYRLEHDALQLEMFIVPLQPDVQGPLYEAIFA
jgi:hypothetical protein